MVDVFFSSMDNDVWDRCSADTNAVEWKNQDSKDKTAECNDQSLQSRQVYVHKTHGSYRCRNCEGCNEAAVSRSTEQRSLRVILMLCMVPLIVKLTYNYCVLLYKQLRVKCSTSICNKSLSLLATLCMCHVGDSSVFNSP